MQHATKPIASNPLAPYTPALIQPGDLMTPREVSETLKVPVLTLANWRLGDKPKLPFVRVGGRLVRYRRADVAAFVAEGGVS
ncbi:MAG: helix-turn-helix domain-containing protein [Lysobacteraceae bacterium]